MTIRRFSLFFLAVLTALTLCACGESNSALVESAPEGLQTFGTQIDPSAQPDTPPVASDSPQNTDQLDTPSVSGTDNGQTTTPQPGGIGQSDTPSSAAPSSAPGGSGGGSGTTPSSPRPSSGGSPGSGGDTPVTPSGSPAVSPINTGASTATIDDVMNYIGKPITTLIAELGYPVSSEYDEVDEDDPSLGEIGTLRFAGGFSVTTFRSPDVDEYVTGVVQ